MSARAQVYFDGSCPLCQREIAFYRRCRGADAIDWVDVAAAGAAGVSLAPDLNREAALARFHARSPDGRLVSGAAAFVLVWQHLPAFQWLARVCRVPGVVGVLELAYRAFLPVRPYLQRLAGGPAPCSGDGRCQR
ncbi:MAG: DUF393 domain-containing protein [Hyphomicrobiaceae bacterium]|nr:DUF393 domain-containing protein [Hyphomicrobiaceae bacterium]